MLSESASVFNNGFPSGQPQRYGKENIWQAVAKSPRRARKANEALITLF
jgi:hypothetical protein